MSRPGPSIGYRVAVAVGIACTLFRAPSLRADLIYFRGGGSAQLPSHRRGDSVVVEGPGGEVVFEAEAISRIVPFEEPDREWSRRRELLGKGKDGRLFDLAWWALAHGLTTEAVSTFRSIPAADPDDARTATLIRALDRVSPPLTDPDPESLIRSIGGDFRVERSPHFLLYHRADRAPASARLELLERVYITYYLTFAAQGLELRPPEHRLVGILYERESDFLGFLERESASAFRTSQGFYHPTRNVVVAFDPGDIPSIRSHLQSLERRRAALRRWDEAIARMPPNARLRVDAEGIAPKVLARKEAARWVAEGRGEADRQALLLDLQRRSIDLGLAAHETVHQLIANSGLAPRHDAFPTWLHEGIAMQFEAVRGGRWAGVGQAHDFRLPDWRAIRPVPRLATLVRDEGYGVGYRRDVYAGAWAFVFFLRSEHPAQFATLVDLLRLPGQDDSNRASRLVETVRKALGADLATVEADWYRFMREARAPLDAGSEVPPTPPRMPSGRD